MTRQGYCFRCDEPAEGEACPRCGTRVYRETNRVRRRADLPKTIGEDLQGVRHGTGRRAIIVIVLVALLLAAIAVVAASTAGVT